MSLDLNIRGIDQLSPVIAKATGKASSDVKSLENKSKSAGDRMKASFKSAASFLAPLGIAAAATIVTRKFAGIVTDTIKTRDEIAKFSRATGASVEFLSSMGFAAERSGANVDSMGKAFARLSRNISDAQRGLSTPVEAFKALGLSTDDLVKPDGGLKNIEDLIPQIANAFAGMSDDTRKAAAAQELFGRSGIELVPLLEEGASGIAALREEAAKLGIVFNEQAAKEAEAAADAITNFNTQLDGFNQSLAAGFLPFFTRELASLSALTRGDLAESFRIANMSVDAYIESLQKIKTSKPGDADFVGPINQQTDALERQKETVDGLTSAQSNFAISVARGFPVLALQAQHLEESSDAVAKMAYVDVPQLDLSLEQSTAQSQILSIAAGQVGARLAEAVVYGENLSSVLKQIIKQLASRALAGFFGAVIGAAIGGPAGALKGFEIGSGFDVGGQPGIGRARGGPVTQNRAFIVGERGPEVFVPNQNGNIIPNNKTTQQMNVTVNIYPQENLSEFYIMSTLMPMITRAVQQGTGTLTATNVK